VSGHLFTLHALVANSLVFDISCYVVVFLLCEVASFFIPSKQGEGFFDLQRLQHIYISMLDILLLSL